MIATLWGRGQKCYPAAWYGTCREMSNYPKSVWVPGDVKLPQGLFDIYGNIHCFGYETIDVK